MENLQDGQDRDPLDMDLKDGGLEDEESLREDASRMVTPQMETPEVGHPQIETPKDADSQRTETFSVKSSRWRHQDGDSSRQKLLQDGYSPKMETPKIVPSPWGCQDKFHLSCRRLTHAAGGFTTPGWPGAIEADKGLLTLQLVAGITVEGGSAPRVQVCHAHIPMGRPGREATAQKIGWIRQSRKKKDSFPQAALTNHLPLPSLFPHPPGGTDWLHIGVFTWPLGLMKS